MDAETLSRRNFLKASGAGMAGILAGCLPRTDPFALGRDKEAVPGSDKWYRGEERMLASACAQCPANCGIHVRVVEGRAVKINGNPNSLLVGGKLGPKGQTGLFTLYDPDRIRGPLKRDGERGSGRWKEISWEEAVDEVAARLAAMRERFEPHKLAVLCGRDRGFMKELLERFCSAYGTPNFFDAHSAHDGALIQAMQLMTGVAEIPGYDAENASYILSLGSGLFEASCNGIHFARATGKSRRENPTRRCKIVQVEPHRSLSAQAADEWVPIKPGAYDALALGIGHILLKTNLLDRDFLERHTRGFDGFREVLEQYPPEHTAALTGIPSRDIHRLAFELVTSKPSVVVVDSRSTATSNGFEIARCALALNAMLGSFEKRGGLLGRRELPLAPWPALETDAVAARGLGQPAMDGRERRPTSASSIESLPESLLAGNPYPAEALFLYYSNPLHSRNNPERFRRAFAKIPFIASFSPFMDEAAHAADLILPDHTYLERWEDALPPPFGLRAAIGLRRPVVEPLYDTRSTGDVLIQIARKTGAPLESGFPWKSFRTAVEERLEGVFQARRGTVTAESHEEFLKKLVTAGYWNDGPGGGGYENWAAAFRTPSGKFEFQPPTGGFPQAAAPEFAGAAADFPLLFMPYKGIAHAEGSGANIPYLQELAGLQKGLRGTESWKSWLEMNVETAQRMGLKHGDAVWVESPAGRVRAHALPVRHVPPDLVLMEMGKGHTQFGRFARGKGANPRELIGALPDPRTGLAPHFSTRVRIAKAAA